MFTVSQISSESQDIIDTFFLDSSVPVVSAPLVENAQIKSCGPAWTTDIIASLTDDEFFTQVADPRLSGPGRRSSHGSGAVNEPSAGARARSVPVARADPSMMSLMWANIPRTSVMMRARVPSSETRNTSIGSAHSRAVGA
jgi:hypothetical protein